MIKTLCDTIQDLCDVWEKKWTSAWDDRAACEAGLQNDLQDLFAAMRRGGYVDDVYSASVWCADQRYKIVVTFVENAELLLFCDRKFYIDPYRATDTPSDAYNRAMKVVG